MHLGVGARVDQFELNPIKHLVWIRCPGTADNEQTSCHDARIPILNGYIHRYLSRACRRVCHGRWRLLEICPSFPLLCNGLPNEGWRGSMIRGM
jgi:hypothetical protein